MGVVVIPLLDVLQHLLQGDGVALFVELQPAPLGTGFGGGGQVDLDGGVGQHDGADVPPVHDNVVGGGQVPLQVQQEGPDSGDGGYGGGVQGHFVLPDGVGHVLAVEDHVLDAVGLVLHINVNFRQQGDDLLGIGLVHPCPVGIQAHAAVDGSGVYI